MPRKERGVAWEGQGYGTMRFQLFLHAKDRIEEALEQGFYCEAIAICESVISDRLESRASFLKSENIGFQVLGKLIQILRPIESDPEMADLLPRVDQWRQRRNEALHELVKVQRGAPNLDWNQRLDQIRADAELGYELCRWVYWRVGELNPNSPDRVFPYPSIRPQQV
jgi:hypothetical protein